MSVDTYSSANCIKRGHLYGIGGRCVFCSAERLAPTCPICGVLEPCRAHVVAPEGLPATQDANHYLTYAARHIRAAIEKAPDAPMSSAQHEAQARLALRLLRVPTHEEALQAWREPFVLPLTEHEQAWLDHAANLKRQPVERYVRAAINLQLCEDGVDAVLLDEDL